mmetsp:Transcript_37280/g.90530  ORF Transcript_37280/g.90530 Transcript_37280/m.90530 type:complete len:316 (+) Transcript_37280:197-1144(+)
MVVSLSSSFFLQVCLLLSFFNVNHGFVLPTSSTSTSSLSIGQHHLHHASSLTAVKKSFDHRSSDNSTNNTNKGAIRSRIQRLRIRNRNKPLESTTSITTPTGPATQYIPSGMTLQEYNQLKQKELDAESAKNYGAWGPRFARSDRPEGDWMVLPQLWTQGAVGGGPAWDGSGMNGNSNERSSLLQQVRQMIPALILSIVLLDSMVTAVTMYKTASVDWTSWRQMAWIVGRRLPLVVRYATKWKQFALMQLTKMHAVKALTVLLTAPLLDTYFLAPVNRYRLWSKRRTVTLSTIGSLGVLGVWALFLGALKRVGMV